MQSRFFGFLVFWIFVSLLLDIYIFTALRSVYPTQTLSRKIVLGLYGGFALLNIAMLISGFLSNPMDWDKNLRTWLMMIFILFFLFKLLFTFFILLDDIGRFTRWVYAYFIDPKTSDIDEDTITIPRYKFLIIMGGILSLIPSISLIYGALFNAYNYQFKRIKLSFENLPDAFHGLKVIQLSDIHSGSFTQKQPLIDVVEKINAENADLIVFTGDIVNNISDELVPYIDIFKNLKATHGVISVLGNHDYGDYWQWNSKEEKVQNFEKLVSLQSQMGWNLLLNNNVLIEKDGQNIAVIGVENWSANKRFKTKGDLDQAKKGVESSPFKILLSHDPTHWEAEILPKHKDIDLTLSGHTHGLQFGIEIPGIIKWSPSKYIYKQWADLYNQGKQYIYVNRGFGFLGYPGRVGILPEISVFTINKS